MIDTYAETLEHAIHWLTRHRTTVAIRVADRWIEHAILHLEVRLEMELRADPVANDRIAFRKDAARVVRDLALALEKAAEALRNGRATPLQANQAWTVAQRARHQAHEWDSAAAARLADARTH